MSECGNNVCISLLLCSFQLKQLYFHCQLYLKVNIQIVSFVCLHLCSYQDRFWRKPVFEGVDLIEKALDDAYGVGKVSMVSAALQWLCHHSELSPEHHG